MKQLYNNEVNLSPNATTISTDPEELTLANLPCLSLIIQYLNLKSTVELSIVCKALRRKLEPTIFRKIKILPNSFYHQLSYTPKYNLKYNKMSYDDLSTLKCNEAIETLSHKAHLVKEIDFNYPANSSFATKFFNIFCYITTLSLRNRKLKAHVIPAILAPLRQLESILFQLTYYYFDDNFEELFADFRLPTTIRYMRIDTAGANPTPLGYDQLVELHPSYTNLTALSLAHTKQFPTTTYNHPSLTKLEILKFESTEINPIMTIFKHNQQLQTLSIVLNYISNELMNTILKLKVLKVLNIEAGDLAGYQPNWKWAYNFTIKEFGINTHMNQQFIICLLHSTRALETFVCEGNKLLTKNRVPWHHYNPNVRFVKIQDSHFIPNDFISYLMCTQLDRMSFDYWGYPGWEHDFLATLKQFTNWNCKRYINEDIEKVTLLLTRSICNSKNI